jgi:uncharacterized iron-regulated membrane protein
MAKRIKEICTLLDYGVFKQVKKEETPYAPPSAVFATADQALEGKRIARSYYIVSLHKPRVNALWALDSSRQYHAVLQNPYTGKIVGNYAYKSSFFAVVTHIHTSLLLGTTGTTLIKYATLIFIVLMITGIILWKPASKKGYKQRFTVKWNASGKRLNYDLHNVLGFYMSWVAIFIAITGLVWSFEWMNNSIQWIANGGKTIPYKKEKLQSDTVNMRGEVWNRTDYRIADSLFAGHVKNKARINAIRVYKPFSPSDVLRFEIETKQGSNYLRTDEYLYDQFSGKLLREQKFADYSNGEKIRRMNYYIHVGSIGGITGKILAFFASLVAASLPVTGFLIWKGRRKKGRSNLKAMPAKATGIRKAF